MFTNILFLFGVTVTRQYSDFDPEGAQDCVFARLLGRGGKLFVDEEEVQRFPFVSFETNAVDPSYRNFSVAVIGEGWIYWYRIGAREAQMEAAVKRKVAAAVKVQEKRVHTRRQNSLPVPTVPASGNPKPFGGQGRVKRGRGSSVEAVDSGLGSSPNPPGTNPPGSGNPARKKKTALSSRDRSVPSPPSVGDSGLGERRGEIKEVYSGQAVGGLLGQGLDWPSISSGYPRSSEGLLATATSPGLREGQPEMGGTSSRESYRSVVMTGLGRRGMGKFAPPTRWMDRGHLTEAKGTPLPRPVGEEPTTAWVDEVWRRGGDRDDREGKGVNLDRIFFKSIVRSPEMSPVSVSPPQPVASSQPVVHQLDTVKRRSDQQLKAARGIGEPGRIRRAASLPAHSLGSRGSGSAREPVGHIAEEGSYASFTSNKRQALERKVVKDTLALAVTFRGETNRFKGGLPESYFKIYESEYLSGKLLRGGDKKRGAYLVCPPGKPLKVGTPIRIYGESVAVEDQCVDCDGLDSSRLSYGGVGGEEQCWPCPKCVNKLVIRGSSSGYPDYVIDGEVDWSVMANHNAVDPDMALTFYRLAPYGIPVAILFAIKEQPGDGKAYEKTWDYYSHYG